MENIVTVGLVVVFVIAAFIFIRSQLFPRRSLFSSAKRNASSWLKQDTGTDRFTIPLTNKKNTSKELT